jgi:hypothetical protein
MWDPRRVTTLWVFTACYRDSFTFFIAIKVYYEEGTGFVYPSGGNIMNLL